MKLTWLQLNQPQYRSKKKIVEMNPTEMEEFKADKKKTHPNTQPSRGNLLLGMVLMNMYTWQQLQTMFIILHILCVRLWSQKPCRKLWPVTKHRNGKQQQIWITHHSWRMRPCGTTTWPNTSRVQVGVQGQA